MTEYINFRRIKVLGLGIFKIGVRIGSRIVDIEGDELVIREPIDSVSHWKPYAIDGKPMFEVMTVRIRAVLDDGRCTYTYEVLS